MLDSTMLEILSPAITVALMISMTHAPLGMEVLRRGIIFLDLAVAQVSGLALLLASIYLEESPWWIYQATAFTGALLCALCFHLMEKSAPKKQEALIGSVFVVAASISLLMAADLSHGGEEIQRILSGQILFVTWKDILSHAPVYILVISLWFLRPIYRKGVVFYLLFSLAITSSVQLVGVYVVFASLILPALHAIDRKRKHLEAWLCGFFSVLLGMGAALLMDWSAGPVIVVAYAFVYAAVRLLSNLHSRIA